MVKLKLKAIQRQQRPSTRTPGQTYTITRVQTEDDRVYSTIGNWADNWKEGDEIEANVEEKQIKGPDGFDITVYNLVNPTPSQGRFGKRNTWPDAYQIALEVLKNPIQLEELHKLAVDIKAKLDQ